jgi:hypothetical protein
MHTSHFSLTATRTYLYKLIGTKGHLRMEYWYHRWARLLTANVDYRLSFADQEKQNFPFPFAANKRKLPFFVSSIFPYIHLLVYIYIQYIYLYI